MKSRNLILLMLLIMALLITSCKTPTILLTPTPVPPTPTPTNPATPIPTNTATPEPTPTEPTADSEDPFSLENMSGEHEFSLPQAGFRFTAPFTAGLEVTPFSVVLFYPEEQMEINLIGNTFVEEFLPAVELLSSGLKGLNPAAADPANLVLEPIVVDGVEGVLTELEGTFNKVTLSTRTLVIQPTETQTFVVMAYLEGSPGYVWNDAQNKAFNDLLATITFLDLTELGDATICPISTDETYGFTQENPIKVGGSSFIGPARERAYLNNLLGAAMQPLEYERVGSLEVSGTILDQYTILLNGEEVTLFLDEYHFEELKAPVGFDCYGLFPLTEFSKQE